MLSILSKDMQDAVSNKLTPIDNEWESYVVNIFYDPLPFPPFNELLIKDEDVASFQQANESLDNPASEELVIGRRSEKSRIPRESAKKR